ncbi:hypothetical protein Q5H93_21575 [Hymenobacter sp. ASUV-10]|uniref:Uncharacterized protein n=1 Tax=Hymenobacter aranciens TaxID=3063996 RepID=A0ABT9BGF7_9BACT|nr:hypothetical protein [Hymenobacter sp. ASUV-10]MDO7877350.1 hypothetical protein [Hymenobacter sp. ASUV-10]
MNSKKNPKPLIPLLGSPVNKRAKLDVSEGFKEGDMLVLTGRVLSFRAGTVLPVLGYCLDMDVDGTPYCLRAYVPGKRTTYAGRQASRFRTALQQEVWFGGMRSLYFTELDVTDHAEAIRLQRETGAIVIPMYDYDRLGIDTTTQKAA